MNPDTYKCVSVGFGIFMLVWMFGALQSSFEGANAKRMHVGEGINKKVWVPVGHNIHFYYFGSMVHVFNNIDSQEFEAAGNILRGNNLEIWSKMSEARNQIRGRLAARCIIFIGEMFMVLISILVLGRRVTGSSKSILEGAACGMLAFGCLICGSIESWFASGKAMGSDSKNNIEILLTTDGWISATAFLFLGIVLWIVNAVVAMMNPISDMDARGYGGSHTNIAGRPSGNFQPQMGYPPCPPPMHP